ncbi:hypothetical protein HDU99_001367 [Rhizoclosmatium hyalinum]|nr:hypothetical protein HDU99_001367 [Rhizoclosmatium hyalinum]
MEQIQREMEAARVKANEEARRLELEEEQLLLAQQREREARALREEYERNAKEKIARMVKGEREPVPVPAAAVSQEEYVDEVDDVYENAEVEQEQIIEMEDLDQDVYEAAESNGQYADKSVVEAAEPVIERPFSFNESVAEEPTYSSYAEREIDLGDDAVVAAEETYVQSVVVNAVSVADVYDAPVESDVNILKDAEDAREVEDDTPYIESVVSNAVSYENTYLAPVDDELFGSEEIGQTAGVASEEMEETDVVVAEETEHTTVLDEPADEFAEVQTREILQETTYTEDVDAEQATSIEAPAYMADEQVLDDVYEPESHEETNEMAVQDVIYAEESSAESVEEPVHIDEAADVEVADVEAAHVEVVDEFIADDQPVADAADDIADDEPVADAADEELAHYDELVVERAESSEEVIEQAYQSVEETVSAEFEEPLQEREVLTVVPTEEFAAAIEAEFENNEVDEPVYDIDEGVVESNFAEVVEGETMEPVYEEAVNPSHESLEEPNGDVPETDDSLDTTIEPTDVALVETAFEYANVSAVQAVEQEEFVIEASQEEVQDSEAFAQEPEFAEVENAQNMVDVSAVDDVVPSSNQDIYNFEPATDDVDVEASLVVPESQPSLDIEGQGSQSFDYGDYGADDVADNVYEAEEYVESTAVEPSVAHSFEDDEVDSEAVEQSEFKIEESYEAEEENHTIEEPAVDFYEQEQEVPVTQVEQSFDFGDYGVEENEEAVEVIADEKVEAAENHKTEVVEDIDDTDFMDSYGVEEENQDDSAQDISTEDYLSTVVNGDEKTEDFRVDDFVSDVFKGTGETFSMEFGSDFKVSDAVSSDVTGEEESGKAKEEN